MKLHILQENLVTGLSHIAKAIPANPQLPILSAVLLEVTENTCTISATDLYFGVKVQLQASVKESGSVAIPGKQFKELVTSLPPGKLELHFTEGTLHIYSERSKTKLQCLQADEYPQFPQVTGEKIAFTTSDFEAIDHFVSFSASSDQARPVLTAVLLEADETGFRAVATDGFRLSVYELPKVNTTLTSKLLIQAKALQEVTRIAKNVDAQELSFVVSDELKQVYFAISDVEIYVRLLDGEFPPYQKIVPSVFTTEVWIDGAELEDQIKRASIFARDASNIIQLQITSETVTLSATSPTLGTFTGEVPSATITGGPLEIAFNTKYVLDMLKATQKGKTWLGMSDSLKPVLCKIAEFPQAYYVIMPFKVTK